MTTRGRVLRPLLIQNGTQAQILPWTYRDISVAKIGAKLGISERGARARINTIIEQNVRAGILPADTTRRGLGNHALLLAHGVRVLKP